MEKKKLDKLFQEKFSDFQAVPDDRVWEKIEASLDKKKKNRVIPIWWTFGGVAALLAVLMYVFIPNNRTNDAEQQIITDSNTVQPNVHNTEDSDTNDENNLAPFVTETPSETLTETDNSKAVENIREEGVGNNGSNSLPSVATTNELTQTDKNQEPTPKSLQAPTKDVVEEVAQASPNSKNEVRKQHVEKDPRFTDIPVQQNNPVEVVAETSTKQKNNDGGVSDTNTNVGAQTEEKQVAENANEENEKKSIFDAIAEQEQDEIEKTEKKQYNRWAMGPSVAPVYFDASGEGSPIHSNFTQNSKSGNLNLSYGLTVSYTINKKLSVRSGVHRVDFGYDTNEISFSSSLQAPTSEIIDNINYSQNSRNLVVRSNVAGAAQEDVANPINAQEFNAPANLLNGRMVQQLGYVEVPVEINYALLDKKFGVNVIGGLSSLFLVDNSVSLESEGLVTNLGSANNVNAVNFSTNIGLGVNYKFTQNIQLNVEPVFKYQLNTFTDTAGSFRPYTIGVYSGVQFKF